MAGLLDGLGEFIKTPEGQGLLSAAFTGLAAGNRNAPLNSIGKAGLGGMLGYSQALTRQEQAAENALQNKIRQMQLGQMQQSQEAAQRRQAGVEAILADPTVPENVKMGVRAGAIDLGDLYKPQKIGPEDALVSPIAALTGGNSVLASGPGKRPKIGQVDVPLAGGKWQMYEEVDGVPNLAKPIGVPFAKRATASDNSVVLPKIEVKTGESIAGQIGPILKESREKAISGMRLVDSAGRILDAADSKNLFAGPGANLLLKGAQVADVLGIGGRGVQEKIANTRTVVRGMAEQAVAARSQLGGQAQISNSEQELLSKATSGDIGELTAGEIVQIAELNDRLGRQLYSMHGDQLNNLGDDPNLAGLKKFYRVPQIAAPRQRRTTQGTGAPAVGSEQGGYRFKGGDPANPASWEKL